VRIKYFHPLVSISRFYEAELARRLLVAEGPIRQKRLRGFRRLLEHPTRGPRWLGVFMVTPNARPAEHGVFRPVRPSAAAMDARWVSRGSRWFRV
jgi:hypothetical protein